VGSVSCLWLWGVCSQFSLCSSIFFTKGFILSSVPVSFREIFPYLVVVIGLENVLVLTKSVVSTPVDLEVKLRIAQGMQPAWSHRTTEWLGLEGTPGIIKIQPPCCRQGLQRSRLILDQEGWKDAEREKVG